MDPYEGFESKTPELYEGFSGLKDPWKAKTMKMDDERGGSKPSGR
jgi:hypothetical protein